MRTKHFSTEKITEIKELRNKGKSHREIGELVGLSLKQVRKFFERQHKRERELDGLYTQTERAAKEEA